MIGFSDISISTTMSVTFIGMYSRSVTNKCLRKTDLNNMLYFQAVKFFGATLAPVVVLIFQKIFKLSSNVIILFGFSGFFVAMVLMSFAVQPYMVFIGELCGYYWLFVLSFPPKNALLQFYLM